MPNMSLKKESKCPSQEPEVRATKTLSEVALGYTEEQAVDEANRCLNCKNKPCVGGCPVAIDIPAFIARSQGAEISRAPIRSSPSHSSLPAVCGRVCPQETQCEAKCVRGHQGGAGGHRPAGAVCGRLAHMAHSNEAARDGPPPTATRLPSSAPAPPGLTCAGDLAKMGYDVTVFEALTSGRRRAWFTASRSFVCPRPSSSKEIDSLKALGVKVETNMVIGKVLSVDDLFEDGFEAVFIGSGAGLPRFMNIPGENLKGVYSANEFSHPCQFDEEPTRGTADTPIQKVRECGGRGRR